MGSACLKSDALSVSACSTRSFRKRVACTHSGLILNDAYELNFGNKKYHKNIEN